jgi:bidirectional [NiFe] hydrogenase diaphorase subunit
MSTPARIKTLKIDGKDVSARDDQTILDAAAENGIEIPTLCCLESLSPWGGCRLCVVEVKNSRKLLPACTTLVDEAMEVATDSERLRLYRRMIVELLLSERNHICSVCVSNGHCELQALAQKLGITHVHVPYRYPRLEVDSSHDRFRQDQNRCVLCTRCIRVCDQIEGAHTKDLKDRGVEAQVINDLNQPWGDSQTCTSCGKCVHVCPTGALTEKGTAAGEMKKHGQFLPYLALMRGAE